LEGIIMSKITYVDFSERPEGFRISDAISRVDWSASTIPGGSVWEESQRFDGSKRVTRNSLVFGVTPPVFGVTPKSGDLADRIVDFLNKRFGHTDRQVRRFDVHGVSVSFDSWVNTQVVVYEAGGIRDIMRDIVTREVGEAFPDMKVIGLYLRDGNPLGYRLR